MAPMRSPAQLALLFLLVACDEKQPVPTPAPPAPSPPVSVVAAALASSLAAQEPSARPEPPTQIATQHILVAWKGAKNAPASIIRSKADAKKRVDEVAAKAKAPGADFSALVAEYSDDEGTKGRQGSLGKYPRSKMTPAFADAAFALAVDQVSDPVETPFGYHVIKRNQ